MLVMVGSMQKHRATSDADVDRLRSVALHCGELTHRLTILVDEDAEAYALVSAAYKLPKDTDADKAARAARIQEALRRAIDVPLDVMRQCADAIGAARIVAALGNPSAASDVGVALELLGAAERGAKLHVDINLASVQDLVYANRVREDSTLLDETCTTGAAAARVALAGSA